MSQYDPLESSSGVDATDRLNAQRYAAHAKQSDRRDKIETIGRAAYSELVNHEFTEQEVVFIESYCQSLDLKRAAKEAGVSVTRARYMLKYPPIQQAIWERVREQKISPAEVFRNVGKISRADMKDYLDFETRMLKEWNEEKGEYEMVARNVPVLNLERAVAEDTTYAIKSIDFYNDGRVKKIILEDKLPANELIGRAFGLFPKEGKEEDSRTYLERAMQMGFDRVETAMEMKRILEQAGLPSVIDGESRVYDATVSDDAATDSA